MKSVIGWTINACRVNGIINFIIVELICFYVTIFRPAGISPIIKAMWYASTLDSMVSFAVVIVLKNRKSI